ncbi:MAG: YceI family protein [Pseudomonadota bacterium]
MYDRSLLPPTLLSPASLPPAVALWALLPKGLLPAALLLGLVTVAGAPPAHAADWIADPEASRLSFIFERFGKPAEGRFDRFEGEGRFEPTDPGSAALELRIETGSIVLGNALESAFATSAEWFDSRNHPVATYRLIGLTPLGEDRYTASGTLEIKGRRLFLEAPLRLERDGDRARATGSLEIERGRYRLGEGPISALIDIGTRVTVRFELIARVIAADTASEPAPALD